MSNENENRFLLTAINAKYIHSNLAVYSLRAAAARKGIKVGLAEFTINHYAEFILQEIYKKRPEVLFFSCYIWNWEYVKELAAECRKIMPQVPIWVGGPEVSYDAARVLRENPAITGVLTGEGEESFPKLLSFYLTGDCRKAPAEYQTPVPEDIEGICFREEEGRITERPQNHLIPMDEIPFAYENAADFENKIIYYESSRGCPFSCSYCLSSIDKKVRFRSFSLVAEELQFFLDAGVPQVKFVDRTFNCRESHALAVWNYILEHDNGVTNFHFEIAADILTEAELAVLERMRPGLVQLEIGVQSTNPRTLEAIHRVMDFEQVKAKVQRIHGFANIHQHLDLIAGLPWEGPDSFAQSFDDVFALRPDQLQLGFLKVLKGSFMYENAEKYGIRYREKAPYEVLCSDWISYGELLRLKGIEQMTEIYYNSRQFSMTLEALIPLWTSPFAFFDELASYYDEQGLNQVQHARVRRYEILLDFIGRKTDPEPFRELLTFDYYLREKAKSRPGFAPDLTSYKETLRMLQKVYGKEKHLEVRVQGTGGEPEFWLFDYGNRNILTKEAFLSKIEKRKAEEAYEQLCSAGSGNHRS